MAKKQLEVMASEALPSATVKQYPLSPFTEGLPQDVHFSSLPFGTKEEVQRLFSTIESAQDRLWDMRGTHILVRDIVVVQSEEEDGETGEIRPTKRLLLITPDGFAAQTPSAAARRSLYRQVSRLAGPPLNRIPPYNPPLRVFLREEPSTDKSKGPWLHPIVQEDYASEVSR